MKKRTFKSNDIEDTIKIASDFTETLNPGDVVALYGKLGAGKTTFIQTVARSLGIHDRVPSPTFILARSYQIPKGTHPSLSGKTLYHIDLFRIASVQDLGSIDLAEIMADPNHLTLIEWAEKATTLLPPTTITINMVYKGEKEREIEITNV